MTRLEEILWLLVLLLVYFVLSAWALVTVDML